MSDGSASGIALEGRLGQAYTEDVFQHLLTIERKRSEQSGRPFALLLVDLGQKPQGPYGRVDPLVARKVFEGLWRCLRETDFVGWYRQERVAGAVLTELPDGAGTVNLDALGARVSQRLSDDLPSGIASHLQVRVHIERAPGPRLGRITKNTA